MGAPSCRPNRHGGPTPALPMYRVGRRPLVLTSFAGMCAMLCLVSSIQLTSAPVLTRGKVSLAAVLVYNFCFCIGESTCSPDPPLGKAALGLERPPRALCSRGALERRFAGTQSEPICPSETSSDGGARPHHPRTSRFQNHPMLGGDMSP